MTRDIAALKASALVDLQAVVGGSSLCRVSALGVRGQSAKYFEGRYAALTEIERATALREDDNGLLVNQVVTRWLDLHHRYALNESESAWTHYAAGGIDALIDAGLATPDDVRDLH